jgi:hypothetical protein
MNVRRTNPLDTVFANFAQLEEQITECLRFIPFTAENVGVVSPKFVAILLESCSLIESIFRRMVNDKKRHTLRTYSDTLEPHLHQEQATTIVLTAPLHYLRSFKGWTHGPPGWWDAYNHLKHNRIERHAAASYATVMEAVARLHQVISRSRLFVDRLPKAGWVDVNHEHIADLNLCTYVGSLPPEIPAETPLFVSPVVSDFADWTSDPPRIEHEWEFSWRVKYHLWGDEDDP